MSTSIPPEIFQNIFKDLDTDSLYSVILVNRIWCSNAISILWQNPLEILYQNDDSEYFETNVKSVIKTYISCLPKESKLMLSFTDLCIDLLTSSIPTFNYPSFLLTLNYVLLSDSVYRIVIDNANVMMVLILLCKLFFDKGFHIKSFELSTHMINNYMGSHFKTIYMNLREIPGADNFLSRIQRLCWRDDAPLCLSSIAEIAKEIRVLDILLESGYENEHSSNELFTLINAQVNLQQITITSLKKTIKAISALRSKSNTLRKIFIKGIVSFSLDFFYECSNLEELSLLYNESHLLTNPQISRQLRSEIQGYIQTGIMDRTQMLPSAQMVSAIRRTVTSIQETMVPRIQAKTESLYSSKMNTTTSFGSNYSNLSKLTVFEINLDSFQTTEQVIDIIQCNKGGLRELRVQKTAPISVDHLKQLFLMVINHCPNLIHVTLCIPNIAISEISNLFKRCLLLEEVYLRAIKTMDISKILDEMKLEVPIHLKSLSLGLYSWKYSFEAINGFLNECELRVNKKPIRFLYSNNLTKDVIDVLKFYELKGTLDLVEKKLWST
ncbi:5060_t:CDS:2 [Cetraspora pellucida]|uniref:5060_t:CDS:1 n=1 Tax=Cetraspora pellucida TaxID=1433469 RepID=A0A9N9AE06_9GLOM|nr:5060_t:CDS:2 [Cetraspora pellucida]